MTLAEFKSLHGITTMQFKQSKTKNRVMAVGTVNLSFQPAKVDFKKQLYVIECLTQNGELINVLCNHENLVDYTNQDALAALNA